MSTSTSGSDAQRFERFENALRSPSPVQTLRSLAVEFVNAGLGRKALYDLFSDFYAQLREEGRHAEEDVVGDVLDMISGEFSPFNIKFPEDRG